MAITNDKVIRNQLISKTDKVISMPDIMSQIEHWNLVFADRYVSVGMRGDDYREYIKYKFAYLNRETSSYNYVIDFLGYNKSVTCPIDAITMGYYNLLLRDVIEITSFNNEDEWRIMSIK